jgi:hypothetical protein
MENKQDKSLIGAAVAILALMVVTTVALHAFVEVRVEHQPGIRMVLPARVGAWVGHELRYCQNPGCLAEFDADSLKDREVCARCGKPLHAMTKVERDVLPADTVFLKGRYTRDDNVSVFVSIVLSGQDMGSIHRPQLCLVAQGMRIAGDRTLAVRPSEGAPLSVMALDIVPAGTPGNGLADRYWKGQYTYWFVGRGRVTPYYLQMMLWLYWDRLVHGVAHRWAYIAVSGSRHTDAAASRRQIEDFVGAFYPRIALPPAGASSADDPRDPDLR